MGVIVISLGTPRSTRGNFGCTRKHLGEPAMSLGNPATSLGAPTTSLRLPATSPGVSRIIAEQSGKYIFFGNAASAPGNHSYYLSFNDC